MRNEKAAKENFGKGFNCAQSVLSAYSGKYGLDEKISKKISCGFGTGCARQSLTCGAVNAAFMIIGLKYGRTEIGDEESKKITYETVNRFSDEFKSQYGSLNCYELLGGCDLATDGGQNYYNENDLFNNECMEYVEFACEILDKMGF